MYLSSKEYNKIISEHFDIFDDTTRKKVMLIEENDKQMIMSSLASKLYHFIVEKVDDIDYGDIPKSKGDISKIPHFLELKECLDTIREILVQNNDDTEPVDVILKSIENLRDSKDIWEKAYTMECQLPIIFYETIALSIVSSVSFLISTSIEYIKEPSEGSFRIAIDKVAYAKSKKGLLFKNLRKFNKAYANGEIHKTMEPLLRANQKVRESVDMVNEISATAIVAGIVSAGVIASIIALIVPILHDLVSMFFCAKQSISEYFDIQANLLALNAETVKLDYTKSEDKRLKIYNKQMKIVETLKKISNKLAVRMKSSEKRGMDMVRKEDSTKYTMDDKSMIGTTGNSLF